MPEGRQLLEDRLWRDPIERGEPDAGHPPESADGDRELGPLMGATLGFAGRMALGEKKNFAVSVMGEAIYSHFFEHLYTTDRLGFLGVTTLEIAFE